MLAWKEKNNNNKTPSLLILSAQTLAKHKHLETDKKKRFLHFLVSNQQY